MAKNKKDRHDKLLDEIKKNPFLNDEDLSEMFNVSIPTIRLDRLELSIPELRTRLKNVAEKNYQKVKSLQGKEIIGELLDIELGKKAISMLELSEDMVFRKNSVVKGQYIYSMAESIAIAVIDADVALVGVASIKYKIPVTKDARLIAKANVKKVRGNKHFVWVNIYNKDLEIFRGKFILVSLEKI